MFRDERDGTEVPRAGKAKDRDETPRGPARDGAKHRGIPTWEEAINMLVSSNLEARAKAGKGGSGPRPRGGRGRGGRGRTGKK
jgi:hypothetical protein